MAANELELVLNVPEEASGTGFTRLRVFGEPERPVFVAPDVGAVIGIKNVHSTLRNFPEDEKGCLKVTTLGGKQTLVTVNEAGLYRLIFASRVPAAKRFQRWVLWEVLPSLRKFGCYPPPQHAGEKPPPGCDWPDVVRTLADNQTELTRTVLRLERKIDAVADVQAVVNSIAAGINHMMAFMVEQAKRATPALPAAPEQAVPHTNEYKREKVTELIRNNPSWNNSQVKRAALELHRITIDRKTIANYRKGLLPAAQAKTTGELFRETLFGTN